MDAPSGQCRAPPSSPVPRVPSLARSEPGGRRRHVARGPLMVYERRLLTPLLSPFLCVLNKFKQELSSQRQSLQGQQKSQMAQTEESIYDRDYGSASGDAINPYG